MQLNKLLYRDKDENEKRVLTMFNNEGARSEIESDESDFMGNGIRACKEYSVNNYWIKRREFCLEQRKNLLKPYVDDKDNYTIDNKGIITYKDLEMFYYEKNKKKIPLNKWDKKYKKKGARENQSKCFT